MKTYAPSRYGVVVRVWRIVRSPLSICCLLAGLGAIALGQSSPGTHLLPDVLNGLSTSPQGPRNAPEMAGNQGKPAPANSALAKSVAVPAATAKMAHEKAHYEAARPAPHTTENQGTDSESVRAWRKAWIARWREKYIGHQKQQQDQPKTEKPHAVATKTTNKPSSPLPPVSTSTGKTPGRNPLRDTRPDLIVPSNAPLAAKSGTNTFHTVDNPFAAVGDGGKMILYLVPTLLLIVAMLHGARKWMERMGPLAAREKAAPRPPSRGGLLALLGANRQLPVSNIRLIESVPLAGTQLHLIEVRGKLLLIGATGTSVNLLTEIEERQALEGNDFRSLLHAASTDLDGVDLMEPDLPVVTVAQSLEAQMRATGQAVTRRARRLRTVREEEDFVA